MKEKECKSNDGKLYIAYGSNLNTRQMQYRCPTSMIVHVSKIKDYELVFRGSKTGFYATIEPCVGKTVPVLLWKTTAQDELALDFYEGYPNFYGKEDMEIDVGGQTVSAYVYIMQESHQLGMPSQKYIDCILEGYVNAGFDPQILQDAIDDTQLKIEDLPQIEMRWW